MIRSVVSISTGVLIGLVAIFLALIIHTSLYPYPAGFEQSNPGEMQAFITKLPTRAFIIKIIFNALACFGAGLVGALVDKKYKFQSGGLAFLLMLSLIVFRDFRFEYPTFYVVSSLACSAVAGFVGVILGGSKSV